MSLIESEHYTDTQQKEFVSAVTTEPPVFDTKHVRPWTGTQKFAFRAAFTYVVLMCIPFTAKYYTYIYNLNWSNLYWSDLSSIATNVSAPQFVTIATESGRWGLASYANLALTLLTSLVIAALWTIIVRAKKTEREEYNELYYWMRVLVRYRVGFAIVAWGYKKLIPMQMVFPTEGILTTSIIDMQEQKLYWQSMGFVPNYQSFLGLAEFLGGFLLLFRKTTALGAALTLVVLANIALANHAYDGGVHISSFGFAVLALIILAKDLPNIWNLLVKEKDVIPTTYYPDFSAAWKKYSRLGLKTVGLIVFVGVLLYMQWRDFHNYRLPVTPGLSGAKGHYAVTEFKLNNTPIAFSPDDSIRWQDATFEEWSTLSFKVNRKEKMDQSNGGSIRHGLGGVHIDIDRSWENASIGGGRHFFFYEVDSVHHQILLQNKNTAHREEKQVLNYTRPSDSRIILSGRNEFNDSIYVVLDKIQKKYPLSEEHREAGVY